MKVSHCLVYFFLLVLMAFAACVGWLFDDDASVELFAVEILTAGKVETVSCLNVNANDCYVFLPAYAEMSDSLIRMRTQSDVTIGDVQLRDGMSCDSFELNTPYKLTYSRRGKKEARRLCFIKSGNVAAMHIDTQTGSMKYIHAEKGNEEEGEIRLYTSDGNLVHAGTLDAIKGRGNYTWEEPDKKPYSLTLTNEADLLGMGKATKWILLANADDPSHLRNKMIFDFADQIEMNYSPDSEWIDLYLNGDYMGLYLLSEKNEVHSQRVDVQNVGSFLVSLEMPSRLENQGIPFVEMSSGQTLRVHFPQKPSQETIKNLEVDWQIVEDAILNQNRSASGEVKQWNEWIDVDSWALKYLIEEIFGNSDGCWISSFFYRNGEDGLIYAGPVWDYDHSTGNRMAWQFETANTFLADRQQVKDGYNAPWFYALNRKPEFVSRVRELYQQTVLPILEEYYESRLLQYAAAVEQAAALDQIRWGIETSVQDEVQNIQAYMAERVDFLSSVWIDEKEYCRVRADNSFSSFYAYYAIEPGECLTELPVLEDTETSRFLGWYYVDSGEPVDLSQPVWEDFQIIARWQETSTQKLERLIKLMPLGVIGCLGATLLWAEIMCWRRAGGKTWRRK